MNIHDSQNIDLLMAGPITVSGQTLCAACGREFLFSFQGKVGGRVRKGFNFFHIFTPFHPFACPSCDQVHESVTLTAKNPTLMMASMLRPVMLTAFN